MRKVLLAALFMVATISAADVRDDLHGSRASFLNLNHKIMTLGYLGYNDQQRALAERLAKINGDTHIYIYSRNDGDGVERMGMGKFRPAPNWEARLDHLNSIGLKPVMWLTPDDSPNIQRAPLAEHKKHYAEMVRRFDGKVAGYVTALEVNETWTAKQAQEMTAYLKSITDKPVGVHMNSGVGGHHGQVAYYKGADYIFLQTGWDKSKSEIKAMVEAAKKLGIPVILSEYNQNSTSSAARLMGQWGCEAGAVGTGNGATKGFYCGQPAPKPEKKDFLEEHGKAIGVGVVVVAAGYVVYRLLTQDDDVEFASRLNFSIDGLDDYMEGSLSYQATESTDVGVKFDNAGRQMGFINIRF